MNVLDLFSGIGGFSLGLERAGMRTIAFCEIEPYARAVLAKHWPGVPCYDDVRTLTGDRLRADGITVDVICGGFPCQDISTAGKGAGIEGARSGLWSEYARLIGELRPGYVIVENVAALLGRGLERVLRDLAALGYDAEWHCIPASAVGAPHRRDRLWLIAYPRSQQHESGCPQISRALAQKLFAPDAIDLADAPGVGRERCWASRHWRNGSADCGEALAHADCDDVQRIVSSIPHQEVGCGSITGPAGSCGDGQQWWAVEPDVGRVAHGVPSRVDRLKGLGNAVVPQIPQIIGEAIMAHCNSQ